MDNQEKKQFNLFKEEIKKYEVLPSELAMMLLSRYTYPLNKRKFFNPSLKMRYYSYWFKILVKSKLLIPYGLGYKINAKN